MTGVLEQAGNALSQERGVFADQDAHGTLTSIVVGPSGGLEIVIPPPAASMRSVTPSSPPPGMSRAPPRPSSWMRAQSIEPRMRACTEISEAPECFAALPSDSATAKYTAASASFEQRPGSWASSTTGMWDRAASPERAASRPRSVSTAGWKPRAS
ncbi:hypothetical protein ACFPRL_06980 [Pseudoclavibacter helvolus]